MRAVVGLCAVFDRTVVAEGIENDEQMRALVGLGVRYGQGYFYGEPAPVAEFEARLLATLSPN